MNEYRLNEKPGEGIARIHSIYWGIQLWCLTNTNVRKDHICAFCNRIIKKGKEKAYRPITNLGNRMDRICETCLETKAHD